MGLCARSRKGMKGALLFCVFCVTTAMRKGTSSTNTGMVIAQARQIARRHQTLVHSHFLTTRIRMGNKVAMKTVVVMTLRTTNVLGGMNGNVDVQDAAKAMGREP